MRRLLAGDAFLIDFQVDEVDAPAASVRDVGSPFGDRDNGLSYGWSSDHADASRARREWANLRFDMFVHFHDGDTWELELSNAQCVGTVALGGLSESQILAAPAPVR